MTTTSRAPALPDSHPLHSTRIAHSPMLQACRGVTPERTPVWFMRQAGRSLPEYREIRAGTRMLDSCLTPDLAAEITLQPVRRYGVDAAILFSDIMVPLRLAGLGVEINPGIGPVVAEPIRRIADVEALPDLDDLDVTVMAHTVSLVLAELGDQTPLIGFCGAPYTVASYLVEGAPSPDHARTRAMMRAQPEAFARLLDWVARLDIAFLRAQILAGASIVQVFDSWVGELSVDDYRRHVMPASARVLEAMADLEVPRIHFGARTGHLLEALREAGADVVGVGVDISLAEASRRLGHRTPVQGNLDPAWLDRPWPELRDAVDSVLRAGALAPGHVFNLGHGVPKDADPAVLARIVDHVHGVTSE